MSGGVDSSVAAALLREAGHEVLGISLRVFDYSDPARGRSCCAPDDLDDARAAARALGIPFYVANVEERFGRAVIDRFVDDYVAGRTPNPCVACNSEVKFEWLLARARGCFVTRGDASDFVGLRAPARLRPGEVVSTSGEVLAQHDGVHRFTVGQRRGLGLGGGPPRYVVRVEAEAARVVVGSGEEASRDRFRVAEVRWVAGAPPPGTIAARVRVRHRHAGEEGEVTAREGGAEVALAAKVRGVAPGQAAVFYAGEEVAGGGRILA